MPNTLAHLGIQGLAVRPVLRDADVKWIFLGCVVPDLPWIVNRIAVPFAGGADQALDLRVYATAQSSLAACLIVSGALAMFSTRPGRAFAVLAVSALLHLLLDASQIKWGNGVHLLAPFSWHHLNFGLYWPESATTVLLTALGIVYVALTWRRAAVAADLRLPRGRPLAAGIVLAAVWLAAPFGFLDGPEAADNHYVKTLRERALRPGRAVQFDRIRFVRRGDSGVLRIFTGEELRVTGRIPRDSANVSVRGRFVDPGTVRIEALHVHWGPARSLAATAGLAAVLALWLAALRRRLNGRATEPTAA